MWQRIQTVFLAVAVISLIAAIFLPVWVHTTAEAYYQLYPLHFSTITDGDRQTIYWPYTINAVLVVAAITLAFITITKYTDRQLQIKLGALNSLFLAGILITSVYFASNKVTEFQGGRYGLGLWLPGIAVICNWLAMRFIRRDEKLVRDSNRLR